MRCKQLSCVNVLSTRDMQFLNALLPIISTDVGISIETNEVHPLNEKSKIAQHWHPLFLSLNQNLKL